MAQLPACFSAMIRPLGAAAAVALLALSGAGCYVALIFLGLMAAFLYGATPAAAQRHGARVPKLFGANLFMLVCLLTLVPPRRFDLRCASCGHHLWFWAAGFLALSLLAARVRFPPRVRMPAALAAAVLFAGIGAYTPWPHILYVISSQPAAAWALFLVYAVLIAAGPLTHRRQAALRAALLYSCTVWAAAFLAAGAVVGLHYNFHPTSQHMALGMMDPAWRLILLLMLSGAAWCFWRAQRLIMEHWQGGFRTVALMMLLAAQPHLVAAPFSSIRTWYIEDYARREQTSARIENYQEFLAPSPETISEKVLWVRFELVFSHLAERCFDRVSVGLRSTLRSEAGPEIALTAYDALNRDQHCAPYGYPFGDPDPQHLAMGVSARRYFFELVLLPQRAPASGVCGVERYYRQPFPAFRDLICTRPCPAARSAPAELEKGALEAFLNYRDFNTGQMLSLNQLLTDTLHRHSALVHDGNLWNQIAAGVSRQSLAAGPWLRCHPPDVPAGHDCYCRQSRVNISSSETGS